ncbi:MAG: ASPIC/UnbV domain-containing protein [Verrucomicrobia bacterium]|nr:ASPIC/UnbV domain-containing protein [Verrucomicrobiota bacterium]
MALADLDNDGDLDVVVNNFNAPASVYRNEAAAPRVVVRLKGLPPNTRGVGARITLRGGAVPLQSQEVVAGGRYLSSDDPVRSFAAGSLTNRLTLEVRWRSGRRSVVEAVRANRLYEVDETGAQPLEPVITAPASPWFEDATSRLGHTHHETPFDDFERQPLLPNLLSQLGPGVAWFDVDRDGWDDLVIGTGAGGRLAVYRNTGGWLRAAGWRRVGHAGGSRSDCLGRLASKGRRACDPRRRGALRRRSR